MASLFNRTGRPILEDRSCFRADHDYGLRYRTALWTKGGRIRLLGGDDVVGHSAYLVVRIRYSGFLQRHSADGCAADGVRDLGWSGRCSSRANLGPIRLSLGA